MKFQPNVKFSKFTTRIAYLPTSFTQVTTPSPVCQERLHSRPTPSQSDYLFSPLSFHLSVPFLISALQRLRVHWFCRFPRKKKWLIVLLFSFLSPFYVLPTPCVLIFRTKQRVLGNWRLSVSNRNLGRRESSFNGNLASGASSLIGLWTIVEKQAKLNNLNVAWLIDRANLNFCFFVSLTRFSWLCAYLLSNIR